MEFESLLSKHCGSLFDWLNINNDAEVSLIELMIKTQSDEDLLSLFDSLDTNNTNTITSS